METETPQIEIENRLREKRQALALSQKQLADLAGITRQAISALESDQYSPATSVALQLARALHCRVEDLFSIKQGGEIIEGELLGELAQGTLKPRVQVSQIGARFFIRPLDGFGELTSLTAAADGLMVAVDAVTRRAKVRLLQGRDYLRKKVVIGGCDPAMFLAAEHMRKYDNESVAPCLMGNSMALGALGRGEIHVAGVHLVGEQSDDWKLSDLAQHLGTLDYKVVTFAHWEEGLLVEPGNRKKIRAIADLARSTVRTVNREPGSGARRLLDRELKAAGIPPSRVKGYGDEVLSHLAVAARVKAGLADSGIGVRAAASICGLDFVPLQRERYDLIIPNKFWETLSGLKALLDMVVGQSFRAEIEALGGYDTRDTGKIVELAS